MVVRYDIATDQEVEITQEWWDQFEGNIRKLYMANRPEVPEYPDRAAMDFHLATYPNPMRDDGVFVAEEKPIEAYPNSFGPNGEQLFPATPKTPWFLSSQINKDFAREIVRRWNLCTARGL